MNSMIEEKNMSVGCVVKKSGVVQPFNNRGGQELESTRRNANRPQNGRGDFATLLDSYAGVVYWLAQYVTGNSKDAEDVLQKTFLTAQSGFTDLKQSESPAMRLVSIAVNESFAKLRNRNASNLLRLSLEAEVDGAFVPPEIADWADDPEKHYTREELRRMVHEGVESLTPLSRIVFLLRDVAQLEPEEIADLFRLSVPRVKSHLLRSRLQLREQLNKYFKSNLKEKAQTA